jgi:hypothetical protein
MRDFGVIFERVPLMCDNTSVIYVAKNPVFHKRMKHLEVRHHFLRDHVEKRDIKMRYIDTERQCACFSLCYFAGEIGVCHSYDLI